MLDDSCHSSPGLFVHLFISLCIFKMRTETLSDPVNRQLLNGRRPTRSFPHTVSEPRLSGVTLPRYYISAFTFSRKQASPFCLLMNSRPANPENSNPAKHPVQPFLSPFTNKLPHHVPTNTSCPILFVCSASSLSPFELTSPSSLEI